MLTQSPAPGDWLLRWRPGQRKTVYLCTLLLAVCAILWIIYLGKIRAELRDQTPGHPPTFGDFLALWSYAKLAATGPITALYDFAALHAGQVALGMNPALQNPFPYPPTFLFIIWPLAWLPYEAAYFIWTIGTLALFVWAVAATCSRLPVCLIAAVAAPATIFAFDAGQTGFLTAALVIAGIRLAGTRPIVSGILIGILSVKPQLGLLVPIALAAGSYWRAFLTAAATVIALAAAATVVFGWPVWPAWIGMLPAYNTMFERQVTRLTYMPTVMANLRMAGVDPTTAKAIQAVVAVIVAIVIWRCFRRNSGRLAAAALLVGTFLATPHTLIYDMPMVTAAVALFIQQRTETAGGFTLAEVVILLVTVMFPVPMTMASVSVPVSTPPLALMFGLILWRATGERRLRGQITPFSRRPASAAASSPSRSPST